MKLVQLLLLSIVYVSSAFAAQENASTESVSHPAKDPWKIGISAGLSSNSQSMNGVSVSPAAYSVGGGVDLSYHLKKPFGLRTGIHYSHSSREITPQESTSVHEVLFSIFPTYQFNLSDLDSTRFSFGMGPAYSAHFTDAYADGFQLGVEMRLLFGKQNRFFFSAKHHFPLYTGTQVRPTLFLAGINL